MLPFKRQVKIHMWCRHSSTFNRPNSINNTVLITVTNKKCIKQLGGLERAAVFVIATEKVREQKKRLQNPIINYSYCKKYLITFKK